MQSHDLRNIAAHGVKDLRSHGASYFTFSRIPGRLSTQHALLLEIIVPLMHQALVRLTKNTSVLATKQNTNIPSLTAREIEVLRWLVQGKTSGEITQILRISENTVRNRVQTTLIKLHDNTRSQAVGKAMMLGLLQPYEPNLFLEIGKDIVQMHYIVVEVARLVFQSINFNVANLKIVQ